MERGELGRKVEVFAIRLGVTILCLCAIGLVSAILGLSFYGTSRGWREFQEGVRVIALLIALAIWFVPMDWVGRRRR